MSPKTGATQVYTDFQRLEDLKRQARQDSPKALANVAKQFEAVFVQMMVKSMRDAGLADGLLSNDRTRFYQDMHDKQLSLHLTDHAGIGLAKLVTRQLGGEARPVSSTTNQTLEYYRNHPVFQSHPGSRAEAASSGGAANSAETTKGLKNFSARPINTKTAFVERVLPFARQAAREIGVAPEVLIAQAALETGWGRSMLHLANGQNSHNLFNIKAGGGWKGPRATVSALEFEDGVMQKRRSNFRAYRDYSESFRDYVDFLRQNPRYEKALQSVHDPRAYIDALKEAGYATDPAYADKVMRIFDQIGLAVAQLDQGARRIA